MKPLEYPVRQTFHAPRPPGAVYASHPHFSHPIAGYGVQEDEKDAADASIDPATVGLDVLAYSAFGVVTGLVFAKFLNVGRARAVKVGVGVGLGKMVWDYGIDAVRRTATPTLKL